MSVDRFRLTSRPRRDIALMIGVALLGALSFLLVAPTLTASLADYDDPQSDFSNALAAYRDRTGVDLEQGLQVIVDCGLTTRAGCTSLDEVRDAVRTVPGVVSVVDAHTTGRADLISADGRHAYLGVGIDNSGDDAKFVDTVRTTIAARTGLSGSVTIGGPTVANAETAAISTTDLVRAELIAFPILFAGLVWVFRNLIAAAIPLVGAGFSIIVAFIPLAFVTTFTDLSTFALNLISALGTGLSIDFSLLIITRFREFVASGATVEEAVRRTHLTAGRTVLYSGLTVAAAVATLCVFPQRFLYSMGLAGASVALAATVFARWVLPRLLSALGGRVVLANARSGERSRSRWDRWSRFVARHPLPVALAGTAAVALLTAPALGVQLRGYDVGVLPADSDASRVDRQVATMFPQAHDDVTVLLPAQGPDQRRNLIDAIGRVPGVAGPARIAPLGPQGSVLSVRLRDLPTTPRAQQTLTVIRSELPAGSRVLGEAERFHSMLHSLFERVGWVIALLVTISCVFLYRLTRSLVIPIKNVLMCSLTVAATIGVLVLAFQWGPLGGPSRNSIEISSMIIVAVLSFGLSTDYASFLFHRMTEEKERGATPADAVRVGLSRTGPVVTAAAGLLFVPLFALTASRLSPVQELGFGAAIAVVLDATVMRTLLVPSLMALLGPWNWWPHMHREPTTGEVTDDGVRLERA